MSRTVVSVLMAACALILCAACSIEPRESPRTAPDTAAAFSESRPNEAAHTDNPVPAPNESPAAAPSDAPVSYAAISALFDEMAQEGDTTNQIHKDVFISADIGEERTGVLYEGISMGDARIREITSPYNNWMPVSADCSQDGLLSKIDTTVGGVSGSVSLTYYIREDVVFIKRVSRFYPAYSVYDDPVEVSQAGNPSDPFVLVNVNPGGTEEVWRRYTNVKASELLQAGLAHTVSNEWSDPAYIETPEIRLALIQGEMYRLDADEQALALCDQEAYELELRWLHLFEFILAQEEDEVVIAFPR